MILDTFFGEIFKDLKCRKDTNAYIVSIFTKYKYSEFDFSKESITLLFAKARDTGDFATFQNVGDYVFWNYCIGGKITNKDYYDTIGKNSYYSCFKMLNKQWVCFEELSDKYEYLEDMAKERLSNIKKLG